MTAPLHDTQGADMTASLRELDHRAAHGIEVTMFWDSADDRVIVTVLDGKTGAAFELEVEPHERAQDVFHHPYAYAASRGIDAPADLLPVA
jgi:hypothetical protein